LDHERAHIGHRKSFWVGIGLPQIELEALHIIRLDPDEKSNSVGWRTWIYICVFQAAHLIGPLERQGWFP